MSVHGITRAAQVAPLVAALAIGATHAPAAVALEREAIACELDGLTRLATLRPDPDADHVCDVLYEKPDENGESRVLWSARNDPDYCKPRLDELIGNLVERGWTCALAEEAAPERPASAAPTASPSASSTAAADPVAAADPSATAGGNASERQVAGAPADASSVPAADRAAGSDESFREWCLADATDAGQADGFCTCLSDGMAAYALSDEDTRSIIDVLPTPSEIEGADIQLSPRWSKRVNTLAVNYEYVVESCRR